MATSTLLLHLRRSRQSSLLSYLSNTRVSQLLHPTPLPSLPPKSLSLPPFYTSRTYFPTILSSVALPDVFHSRFISTHADDDSLIRGADSFTDTGADSELINVGLGEVAENVALGGGGEDSILPVNSVISMLDGYHELTGLPWWIIIASSTLVLRVALLPVLILQLHKFKRIGELFGKLPPPFPPPLSGKSYINQFSLFWRERKAVGCPSFLWFLAYASVQVPCFILWMTSIRKMSLDDHPGFDLGGALWFQNLTELPHGILGSIFPLLIASLHYINVQISFQRSFSEKDDGLFSSLAKYYKSYLHLLSLPILFAGYCIPQGSLVYWVTNSSLTVIQQLSLRHPAVRAKLWLPDQNSPTTASEDIVTPKTMSLDSPNKWGKIPVQDLSPKELVSLSVPFLSNKDIESAVPLLKLALDKDPEYVRALIMMGQTLLQKGLPAEATEHLERAVSKLFLAGHPTDVEGTDLLILASQWAGLAWIRQGKMAEGLVHLERVANLKEPEDPLSKAHYFDGLLLFASALSNSGRKAEATNYLRLAAAYNPAYKEYLEQSEREDDTVTSLVNSKRDH
ncbi:ALBINO3-like protein 2, chloroplastic [Quillaja saponaria]|uniref:ALBINO3-like protein 2, chloroplastic n=1 Tax=Quillaja saponaria TaxID=32244 RepID=A0AAD7QB31_QUISA|nr:ALBINO3-like protein 2, chloroplastic [Quillaja saponaria]